MKVCIIITHTDQFGLSALSLQQSDVYGDLSDILETDFTGRNKILTELKDLYSSCLIGLEMSDDEIRGTFIPAIRNFYENLGQYNYTDIVSISIILYNIGLDCAASKLLIYIRLHLKKTLPFVW